MQNYFGFAYNLGPNPMGPLPDPKRIKHINIEHPKDVLFSGSVTSLSAGSLLFVFYDDAENDREDNCEGGEYADHEEAVARQFELGAEDESQD